MKKVKMTYSSVKHGHHLENEIKKCYKVVY